MPDPGVQLAVDITEEHDGWRAALGDVDARVEAAVRAALAAAPAHVPRAAALEVSVVLADDAFVRDLNARYRGKDKATNVLSFPSGLAVLDADAPRALGDLVLAFETVAAEARAQGKPLGAHAAHLLVHGTLHLVGFTHDGDGDGDVMVAAECAALATLGVDDPYEAADGAAA